MRVLVVEDNQELREMVQESLAQGGHEVRGARDGLEALELLEEFSPNIMLLDIDMPRLSGHGVIAALRRMHGDRLPFTVVVMSSNAAARSSWAGWFLAKPFFMDAVNDLVNDVAPEAREAPHLSHSCGETQRPSAGGSWRRPANARASRA